jgi:hypothetical protein
MVLDMAVTWYACSADTWPQALAIQGSPTHVATAVRQRAELVDDIWHAAGDTSVDYNWYTKRGLLAGDPVLPLCCCIQFMAARQYSRCRGMCLACWISCMCRKREGARQWMYVDFVGCRRVRCNRAFHADRLLPGLCGHLAGP